MIGMGLSARLTGAALIVAGLVAAYMYMTYLEDKVDYLETQLDAREAAVTALEQAAGSEEDIRNAYDQVLDDVQGSDDPAGAAITDALGWLQQRRCSTSGGAECADGED